MLHGEIIRTEYVAEIEFYGIYFHVMHLSVRIDSFYENANQQFQMAWDICSGKDVSIRCRIEIYILMLLICLDSGLLARLIQRFCRDLFVWSTVVLWIIVLKNCHNVQAIIIELS